MGIDEKVNFKYAFISFCFQF